MRMAHGGAAGVHMRTKTSGNGNSPKSRNSTRSHVARQAPRGSPLGGQMPLDQTLRVCRRFYVALMLSRLVQVLGEINSFETVWIGTQIQLVRSLRSS